MKTAIIGRAVTSVVAILFISIFSVADVQAWNWGTHAYIDDHLGKSGPFRNMNEMYGSTAPDLFNYTFDHPELYAMTHNDFMKVWKAGRLPLDKASAFGFVSHNDMWGADSTAHHACASCGDGSKGYVIKKAELMIFMGLPSELASLYQTYPGVILEIYHNFVEAGVDILIKQLDPTIGNKLASAALLRSPGFPLLLVRAYKDDVAKDLKMNSVDAAKFIITAEKEFRKSMILYGQALAQDNDTAVQLLSEQLASVAEAFLGAYGINLGKLGITDEQVIELTKDGIQGAISVCQDDYQAEIEGTIKSVRTALKANGVSY